MDDLTRLTAMEWIARRDRLYRFVLQCRMRGIVPTTDQAMAAMANDRSEPLFDELFGTELTMPEEVLTGRGTVSGVPYNPSDAVNHELLATEPDFVERMREANDPTLRNMHGRWVSGRYERGYRILSKTISDCPPSCQGCINYYGETHGGNKLICAIHPSGVDGDTCLDKVEG